MYMLEDILEVLSESTIDRLYESEPSLFTESVFVNKNDLYKNIDKFENGKTNILLITGLSGSGKSTLASEMCLKYNAEYIELDIIDPNSNMVTQGFDILKAAGEVFYDFFKLHKKYYDNFKKLTDVEIGEMYDDFLKYCFSWCIKHSDKKYVIEGIQIYEYYSYNKKDVTYPIIIKGTSVITSFLRKIKREEWTSKDILKNAHPVIKLMIKCDNDIKQIKKSLNDK